MKIQELRKLLEDIKTDCLKLKKQNYLTEFGKGELHIILMVEEYLSLKVL